MAKEKKVAEGMWEVELLLQCPHCQGYIDYERTEPCIQPGQIYKGPLTCTECGKFFSAKVTTTF